MILKEHDETFVTQGDKVITEDMCVMRNGGVFLSSKGEGEVL